MKKKGNEPIQIGDVTQYWDPMFYSVDKRGLKEATVSSTSPKEYPVLVISSGGTFLPDANAKRLRFIRRKKLEDHSFELFRQMTEFKLNAANDYNHGSFAQGKSNIIMKNLQKHLNKFHENLGKIHC